MFWCVVTECLHVIITTQFEAENTNNRHKNANTDAEMFLEASTSFSTIISPCESSKLIVCIGVPKSCIPPKIAKKTPDL